MPPLPDVNSRIRIRSAANSAQLQAVRIRSNQRVIEPLVFSNMKLLLVLVFDGHQKSKLV